MKKAKKPQAISNNISTQIPIQNTQSQWLPMFLLATLAFLLYANTLNHGYALDDYSVIKENFLTKQGVKAIPTLLTTEYRFGYWNSVGSLYRPLSLLMFAIEWQFSPDKPFLSHFINVFLYALTAVLIFKILIRLLPKYAMAIPFIITALFVAHPIHTEVVANIKSRDEILAFLGSLLALHFLLQYIDSQRLIKLIIAIFCYTLAMFSKESAITFLAIFPLTIYFFKEKTSLSDNLKACAYFLLPVIFFLIVRASILGKQVGIENVSPLDNMIAAQTGINKFAAAVTMAGYYLKALFFPTTLVSDLGFNQVKFDGVGDWKVLSSFSVYSALVVFAFWKIKTKNLIAFGILLWLITFSISSNIFIQIGTAYGERLLYASSLGSVLTLVALGLFIFKENENTSRFLPESITFKIAVIAMFGFFSVQTITRNPAWKNSYTLYETDIKIAPNCAKLNYHYALELTKKGRDEKSNILIDNAITYFEKSISIYPKNVDAFGEMGLAYFYKGDITSAMTTYEKANAMRPEAKVLSNMGIVYFQQGKFDEAVKVYEKAVALDPRFVDARRNLGCSYATQRRFPEAIKQLQEAIKYAPEQAILYYFLGSAYKDSGDNPTAQRFLTRAYQLDPSLKK